MSSLSMARFKCVRCGEKYPWWYCDIHDFSVDEDGGFEFFLDVLFLCPSCGYYRRWDKYIQVGW